MSAYPLGHESSTLIDYEPKCHPESLIISTIYKFKDYIMYFYLTIFPAMC